MHIGRREFLESAAAAFLLRWPQPDPDHTRLAAWVKALRSAGRATTGRRAVQVGELAAGTPYVPNTLEEYLKSGNPTARADAIEVVNRLAARGYLEFKELLVE